MLKMNVVYEEEEYELAEEKKTSPGYVMPEDLNPEVTADKLVNFDASSLTLATYDECLSMDVLERSLEVGKVIAVMQKEANISIKFGHPFESYIDELIAAKSIEIPDPKPISIDFFLEPKTYMGFGPTESRSAGIMEVLCALRKKFFIMLGFPTSFRLFSVDPEKNEIFIFPVDKNPFINKVGIRVVYLKDTMVINLTEGAFEVNAVGLVPVSGTFTTTSDLYTRVLGKLHITAENGVKLYEGETPDDPTLQEPKLNRVISDKPKAKPEKRDSKHREDLCEMCQVLGVNCIEHFKRQQKLNKSTHPKKNGNKMRSKKKKKPLRKE